MLISNETEGTLASQLKEKLEELLKKEETQVYHGVTKHDIPFRITIKDNPAAKLLKVEVDICAQTRITGSVPYGDSKAKTNRAFALTTLYTKVATESRQAVFDIVMQGIREQDLLDNVLNGLTNSVRIPTPLGIEIYCHSDTDHRVFQILRHGKQVYAFEEALSLENGGDALMMRPTEDLVKMSNRVLLEAFIEGEFTPFHTEVLL